MSWYTKWSRDWHIMFWIHHFVNLNELELHLCLPTEWHLHTFVPSSVIRNKLHKLEKLNIQWYYGIETRRGINKSHIRIESDWYDIILHDRDEYIPSTNLWNDIVARYHQYFFTMAHNLNDYTLKCPQWRKPISKQEYRHNNDFLDTLKSINQVSKLNISMIDDYFTQVKIPIILYAKIEYIRLKLDTSTSSTFKDIFDDIVVVCCCKSLKTASLV